MDRKLNIQFITDNALCTACGACCGVCPTKAILMEANVAGYLVANIDFSKCIYCGMCYNICPSVAGNILDLNECDIFHGMYLDGFVGHAVDKEIRQKAQSGGIVTALLCFLLEKELIDGAIVNKFNETTKRPEAVYEDTKEQIIQSSGSYYTQSSVVKEILNNQDKRTAAVVLGCQAGSLNLIKKKYPKFVLPEFTIGLICAGQYSGKYIDELIGESRCNIKDVMKFRFRDKDAGGWPGDIKIYSTEKDYILNKKKRHVLKSVYEVYRCLLCFDQMNIFSDITVGDPWGINNKLDKEGNSVIIARTEKGKALIEEAQKNGVISVERLDVGKIIQGQTVDNRLKTQFFTAKDICNEKGLLIPFDEKIFNNILYEKPTNKKIYEIKRRLEYSRKVFLEEDKKEYCRLVANKKKKIKKEQKIKGIVNFSKRCINFGLRKIGIKSKQNLK